MNKFDFFKFKKAKKKSGERLKMLLSKASDIVDMQNLLDRHLPENLREFCRFADFHDNSIVIFIYPAIYLRQIKAHEKQIIANMRAEMPEKLSELTRLECKVRPLKSIKEKTQEQEINKQRGSDSIIKAPKERKIPPSIKQKFLELAKEAQDPKLKEQFEKMAGSKINPRKD